MILSPTYIQDESTKTLVFYVFLFLIIFFLVTKWVIFNKKKAEKNREYYYGFFTDFRLYGVLVILLIGLYAMITEIIKRLI